MTNLSTLMSVVKNHSPLISIHSIGRWFRSMEGNMIKTQEFTTSGTWNVPSGVKVCQVLLVGGGGGGASQGSTTGGGGGGGGEIVLGTVYLGSTTQVSITIGSGGLGGTTNNVGQDGNFSSFGNFVKAYPGLGGLKTRTSFGSKGGQGGGQVVSNWVANSIASIGGYGGGEIDGNAKVGKTEVGPRLISIGGSGGGQGFQNSYFAYYGANNYQFNSTGGTATGSNGGGGGGASYGNGGNGAINAQSAAGGSALANSGGGGGGGYDWGVGGNGGSGYCVVFYE